MTTYNFDLATAGDWNNAADWTNDDVGHNNAGVPGGDDSAFIHFFNAPTVVTTELNFVSNLTGDGDNGVAELDGAGLSVSGTMDAITLLAGDYTAATEAFAVTVMNGATLSGGAIGGTSAGEGAIIQGGTVGFSSTFWGAVISGLVNTAKLLSATLSGGTISAKSVNMGPNSSSSVTGGALTDTGALKIHASSAATTAILSVSGGQGATVGGAAHVGNFGHLNLSGSGKVALNNGLVLAQTSGSQSYLDVGSPSSPGGTLRVNSGPVILGGPGTATVDVMNGGHFKAKNTSVTVGNVASSSTSVVTVGGGKMVAGALTIGLAGNANLVVSGGGSSESTTLTVAADLGSVGTIKVKGSGSSLSAQAATVGGTASANGNRGTIAIKSGADADFGSAKIWALGKVAVGGLLQVGDVRGRGVLEIQQGGDVVISAGTSASLEVDFSGAGALDLLSPLGFTSTIDSIVNGASITAAGFNGGTESFVQSSSGGEVFLTGAGVVAAHEALHFFGNYAPSNFIWNPTNATLTFSS